MVQQNCQEETTHSENPLKGGTCKERRPQWRTSRRTGRVSTDRNRRWCWSSERLLVDPRWLHWSSSHWTSSSTLCAERRNIPCSTEIHRRDQSYTYEFGCQAREAHRWLLEYRWVSRPVWSLDRFHTIYSIGRKNSRRIYVVRRETDKTAGNIQARSSMARALEINGKARQAEGEAKVVTWKTSTR